MKRWGLIGLVALAACAPEGASYTEAKGWPCLTVNANTRHSQEQDLSATGRPEKDEREPFIIRYRGDAVSAASRVRGSGGDVTMTYRTVPAVAARLSPRELQALATDPLVESVEPDEEWRALGPASLPALAFTAAAATGSVSGEYTDGLRQVQAPAVWDLDQDGQPDADRPTGAGVKVCIIDSGLDLDHPELRGAVVAGHDFLDRDERPEDRGDGWWGSGHGTHVAGILGARPGGGGQGTPVLDGRGMVGVAPGVQLVIARVLDLNGRTQLSFVLAALEYCSSQGAKVASLSLGGGLGSRTSREAFKAALDGGMLVVAASGNDGGAVSYPASDPSVLAVGAVDAQGQRAHFSNGGHGLALVAPGVDVLSTFPRGLGAFSTVKVGDTEPVEPLSRPLLYAPTGEAWGPLVDCGAGESPASCRRNTCDPFIAYVRFGFVLPEDAMANVMMQGARAVIFGTEEMEAGADILSVPQSLRGQWVPAITVNQAAGTVLHRQLGQMVRLHIHQADYVYMSGTSMAAPYVSGVAALLFSAHPEATPAGVKQALLSTAKDLGPEGWDDGFGHGMVQAGAALKALGTPLP